MASRELPLNPSSNLAGAAYDDETQTLTITFASGSSYVYSGVGAMVAEELSASSSPGQFFHRHVRERYPFVRES